MSSYISDTFLTDREKLLIKTRAKRVKIAVEVADEGGCWADLAERCGIQLNKIHTQLRQFIPLNVAERLTANGKAANNRRKS